MKEDVYSQSKIAFHQPKLESFMDGEITAPIYVRVKPTNICNHACYYCSYQPDYNCVVSETINLKDSIPKEKLLEILDDFKDIGVKAITYSGGGEPLIYNHIQECLEKTVKNKIELSIITNGQKLNRRNAEILSQAEWVRVSADYCNAETFQAIRKRPESWFYELRDNIKNFAQIKKK